MRATEFLIERATSVVFHYTNMYAALKILKSGNFELASAIGDWGEEQVNKGYPYYLSLTRTPTSEYISNKDSMSNTWWAEATGVIFKMNGDWLNNRYVVKPVDFFNGKGPQEFEDRVFSKTPTIPITPVTEVHVLLQEDALFFPGVREKSLLAWKSELRAQIRQIIITSKQRGIQVFLYTDKSTWSLLDKRKSVQPSQYKDMLKGKRPQEQHPGYDKPTDLIKPWIELIEKDKEEHLSDKALENLWYPDTTIDDNIGYDLKNERYPGSEGRASAVKLIKYMNDNGFKNTTELKNAIYNKWNKLKK
jgi:hypothetical protein